MKWVRSLAAAMVLGVVVYVLMVAPWSRHMEASDERVYQIAEPAQGQSAPAPTVDVTITYGTFDGFTTFTETFQSPLVDGVYDVVVRDILPNRFDSPTGGRPTPSASEDLEVYRPMIMDVRHTYKGPPLAGIVTAVRGGMRDGVNDTFYLGPYLDVGDAGVVFVGDFDGASAADMAGLFDFLVTEANQRSSGQNLWGGANAA